jgi:hypothetical protein
MNEEIKAILERKRIADMKQEQEILYHHNPNCDCDVCYYQKKAIQFCRHKGIDINLLK